MEPMPSREPLDDPTAEASVEERLRRTEATRRRQDALVSALLDNLTIGVFMVEVPGGKPLVANKSAQRLLGRGILPDATGENLADVYKARRQGCRGPYPVDEMPVVRGMRGESAHVDDMVVERPDGSEIALEVFGTPITDDQGRVWASLVSFHDISDRKRTEEALRTSEAKLSALFSSMTEMVVVHELVFDDRGEPVNYRILDCNRAYTATTGIRREDAVGRLATDVYGTPVPPYLAEFSRVAQTGEPLDYTTYFAPMAKHFSISVVSPAKNHFATVTTDITAIKQIQDVIAAKNAELENYLYVASHDLRSPLVNVQGFSRRLAKQAAAIGTLLADVPMPDRTRAELDALLGESIPRTFDFIQHSVARMDALLNGLLTVSRTGRARMTIREVDTGRLLAGVLDGLGFQLTEIGATVHLDRVAPCYGDEQLLSQLFSNLIGNAIKYRDPSRPLVMAIGARTEGRKVIYSVRDNGVGIASRHLPRIWDVFYRVDGAQPDSGDGLGLSIVKRIAEKHQGRVWAESEPGEGSVFHVELKTDAFVEEDLPGVTR